MNPPYEPGLIDKFIVKLMRHFKSGEVSEAVVLVNNATETQWFQEVAKAASAICFPAQRLRFRRPDGSTGPALRGQAVLYLGEKPTWFAQHFKQFGFIVELARS